MAVGANRPDLVVLDGEVSNSTFTADFNKAYPGRFFELYIAEQQLVCAAVGLSILRKVAFAATFGAFFTRAFDQIRMAAVSGANIRLCGSHVGVSIGEDGPSQMALEDLAMMQAVHGSTVLYPCDANQTAHLVNTMADLPGISYLRTTRGKTPVIHAAAETFPVGGSKMVRHSDSDQVAIIAAGITLHESIRAYELLKSEGIRVRVIDAYCVKPIDKVALHQAAQVTGGRLVVVEDHWFEGGIGDAVLNAFAGVGEKAPTVVKLAVRSIPTSGTPPNFSARLELMPSISRKPSGNAYTKWRKGRAHDNPSRWQSDRADLVGRYPQTRPVFEKHGIDYCCGGGKCLADAANEHGLKLLALVDALGKTLQAEPDQAKATAKDWYAAPLGELVSHIVETHHGYMKTALTRLRSLVPTVLKAHGVHHGEVLRQVQDLFKPWMPNSAVTS